MKPGLGDTPYEPGHLLMRGTLNDPEVRSAYAYRFGRGAGAVRDGFAKRLAQGGPGAVAAGASGSRQRPHDPDHRSAQFRALDHHGRSACSCSGCWSGSWSATTPRPIRRRPRPRTTPSWKCSGRSSRSRSWSRSRSRRSGCSIIRTSFRQADMTIKAIGKQWYWTYEYPDNGNFTFDALMLSDRVAQQKASRGCSAPTTTSSCRSTRPCASSPPAPT